MTDFLKELCRYDREDINLIIDKYAKPPKLIRVVCRVWEENRYEPTIEKEDRAKDPRH